MFGNSWQLVKASYSVLQKDRELMLFPLFSTIGLIIVTISFMIPLAALGVFDAATSGAAAETASQTNTEGGGGVGIGFFVIAFLFYLVTYTVIIYSNTALIGAALMRLRGEDPTFRDGLQIANQRIGTIIGYAAISATVGMILQAIRGDEDNIFGQIVAAVIGTAWSLITFLVIPVFVVENLNPIDAIKRSGTLLKSTWGENVVATFGMGIIQFVAMIVIAIVVGAPVYLIASATGSSFVVGLGIAIVVLAVAIVSLFFAALNGIFQAALYNYATEGEAGEFFPQGTLEGAFHHK